MTRSVTFAGLGMVAMLAPCGYVAAEVGYPSGTQNFEALTVGDDLSVALPNWVIVDTSALTTDFTVNVAEDVLGDCQRRCDSARWLRSRDIDGSNAQNRFYSPGIVKQGESTYHWTLYVNLETVPPGGTETKPKLTIQHRDGANAYANAWGIEFTATGANLIVLGIGGTPNSTALYPLSGPTSVGQWVKLDLIVDFSGNMVSASANNGSPVTLPINLNGNPSDFRFCYRGEGAGNVQTFLLDDVSVCVGASCPTVPACTTARQCPALRESGMAVASGLLLGAGCLIAIRRKRIALTSLSN